MSFYSQCNLFILVHAGFCSMSLCVSKKEWFFQPLCMWRGAHECADMWAMYTNVFPYHALPYCSGERVPHQSRSSPFWIGWLSQQAFGRHLSPNTVPIFVHGFWSFQLRSSCLQSICSFPVGTHLFSPSAFCVALVMRLWFVPENLLFTFGLEGYFHCVCCFRWMHPFSFRCSLTCMAWVTTRSLLCFHCICFLWLLWRK